MWSRKYPPCKRQRPCIWDVRFVLGVCSADPVAGTAGRRFVRADVVQEQSTLPEKGEIEPNDVGLLVVDCLDLPLGYGVIQVSASDAAGESIELWALLRISALPPTLQQ